MSSHQSNKDKPLASKCHHFCHAFDTHNYCPTCREAGKGDDPCVTFISPCEICTSFTEEQLTKITHRKRYVKKPDKKADKNDQELDLLCPPHWGVDILFLLFPPSAVPFGFQTFYPIFTKFGMQVYWVNSLYGIAFGDDSSIAN